MTIYITDDPEYAKRLKDDGEIVVATRAQAEAIIAGKLEDNIIIESVERKLNDKLL